MATISCAITAENNSKTENSANPPDIQDRACAYFYYLWGNHAEYNQDFSEALDAFEKAHVCAPEAPSLLEKLALIHLKMGDGNKAAIYLSLLAGQHPEDIEKQLLLARLFIHLNRFDDAVDLYRKILESHPENEDALIQLSLIYSIKKEFTEAEAALRSVIKINNESYPATLYLARLLSETGRVKEAATWYQKTLELSWSHELIDEAIQFYSAHQLNEEMLSLYSSVLGKEPTNEMAGLGLVHTLLLLGRETDAMAELSKLKHISETPYKYDLVLGKYYFSKNEFNNAETVLKKALKKENNSSLNYLLALVYFEQNEDKKALEQLQQIKQQDDEYQESIYLQIEILQNLKNYSNAILLLQQKMDDQENTHPIDYILLSSLYQDTGKLDLAIDILKTGTRTFPESVELLFELGILYDKNGKVPSAINTMQQLLMINKNHAEALNYIGYTWADKNINLQQALDYIQQAVNLLPENGYLRDSLGWVYFRLGDLNKARKELEYAISLTPDDPLIYKHLGDVYDQLLVPAKAVEFYRKAIELSQQEKEQELLQNKINALRSKE